MLGLVHSILGPALAGFNIALIITSFYNTSVFDFSLINVFDGLSIIGVNSDPLKWFIVIFSIILGLHGQLSINWLQEKFS